MDKHTEKRAKFFLKRLPRPLKNISRTIVDIGCCSGSITEIIAKTLKKDTVIGVDVSDVFLNEAKKQPRQFQVIKADVLNLPFLNESIDVFILSSVLHEIYSYNGFTFKSCKEALSELHRCLRKGGRVIIHDPAKPSNHDEKLHIYLDQTNGLNPNSIQRLCTLPPNKLSTFSLFKKFVLEYKPLSIDKRKSLLQTLQQNSSYLAEAWIITEFIRKRKYIDSPKHWRGEMQEQNAAFTVEDIKSIARKSGFLPQKIHAVYNFESNFYARIKREDKIKITDKSGNRILQKSRFPSHLYVVLEK